MDEILKKTLKEIHRKRKKRKEKPNKFWHKYEGATQFSIVFFLTFIVSCVIVYGAIHLIEGIEIMMHF